MGEMISVDDKKLILRRLADARMRLIMNSPFYGNLVLHMKFVLAQCGTAATDMKRILFDPEFVLGLSDRELDFVVKHEIMHCVLQHCIRGRDKNQHFFNIACDIVVNSNIMQSMGVSSITVAGEEAMHLTPEGKEGYLYSAEEVYEMLIEKYDALIRDVEEVLKEIEKDYGTIVDRHEIWSVIPLVETLSNEWKMHLKNALANCGETVPGVRKFLEDLEYHSKLNWRAILHDFIVETHDEFDYSFSPPDRRFSAGDFILPSFSEIVGDAVDNLWFVVDASGSISVEELSCSFEEIKAAINQFDSLSGKLSFFDMVVSEPKEFADVDTLKSIEPVGGGGTSFHCIFKYMEEHMINELPTAVIILTDGYAPFPQEEIALGVPTLWIIAGDNTVDAPWGVTIHI